MPQAIVFKTKGLIDLRAFTTFGVNAKPNSANPIDFFGTGLKYAVAVLVRSGAEPVVWIGKDKYTFSQKNSKFRDKAFDFIRMKRERWSLTRPSYAELPFTTELGKKWEMWMAFRELESNTRDEGGETFLVDSGRDVDLEEHGYTVIIIEHEEFVQAYLDRYKTFLPDGMQVRESSALLQVLQSRTKHLYYRGLRVVDLDKPTIFTYNFLISMDLTEDRTLKYEFMARHYLAQYVAESDDETLIERILTAPSDLWEHGLEFTSIGREPSAAFKAVALRRKRSIGGSAWGYFGSWTTQPPRPTTIFDEYPRPWRIDDYQIKSQSGVPIFLKPPHISDDWDADWERLAGLVLERVNEPVNDQLEEEPLGPENVADAPVSPERATIIDDGDDEIPF